MAILLSCGEVAHTFYTDATYHKMCIQVWALHGFSQADVAACDQTKPF